MDKYAWNFFLFIAFLGRVSFILILVRKSVDFGFETFPDLEPVNKGKEC